MKCLLLVLFLFPLILFGQTGRKDTDSLKAAILANLHSVSSSSGNGPGSRVESIRATDSGDYVTLVVRVHVARPENIADMDLHPLAKMKTKKATTARVATIPVPHLPRIVAELDEIPHIYASALVRLKIHDAAADNIHTIEVPSLPHPVREPEAIRDFSPTLTVMLRTAGNRVAKIDTMEVQPLPQVVEETDLLPRMALIKLPIVHPTAGRMDTMMLPRFDFGPVPVEGMHLSDDGYSLLEKLEGFSPELYSLKDGGFTIGFGFFVPYGEGRKWDKGVSWSEAERLIRQKVPSYEDQVKKYINVPLTQNEFDALTMLAYNLGGFSKATSIVNDVNNQAGFEKLQSDWNRFVHSKAPGVTKGLLNRRKDELGVRREANYQPERKIQVLKTRN